MATKTFCDGCAGECGDGAVTTLGRYDPAVYCAHCCEAYRALEAAERALHAQLVRAFEATRATLRAEAKTAGLMRLPDEE